MATMSEKLREAVLSYEYGGAIHPKNVTAAADLMDEMAKALEPFAGEAAYLLHRLEDDGFAYSGSTIKISDLRAARAILTRFREAG